MIKAIWGINTGKKIYKPGDIVTELSPGTEADLVSAGHAEWISERPIAKARKRESAKGTTAGSTGADGTNGTDETNGTAVELMQWVKRGGEEVLVKESEVTADDERILLEDQSGKQMDAYGASIGVDTTKKSAKADKFDLIRTREFELMVEFGRESLDADELARIEAMDSKDLDTYAEELGIDGDFVTIETLEGKRTQLYWSIGATAKAEADESGAPDLEGVDESLL